MGGVTRTLGYSYDVSGNRSRITHPDLLYFDYSYDALNRPAGLYDPTLAPIQRGGTEAPA